ncbi:OsmC family protein [Occallatibacter riparius]|uniref:OsmC family protein n=1 Tax=Occallatibacter riparius TaxID=1002689 RepID=A0A9J7BYV7_9BACT|nr:OsmC family protein [Occallatibacter riparius]UWZ86622.1 OsmC family protein [Occallatibacter riparius]
MTSDLSIRAVQQGAMRVTAADGVHQIQMDYPTLPGESVTGLTPLKTLLASLAACSANSVRLLLERKLGQTITCLEVHAHASRRTEHPTVLTAITLEFLLSGPSIDPKAVDRALALSEQKLCPVWNMLKTSTPITATYRIVPEPPTNLPP